MDLSPAAHSWTKVFRSESQEQQARPVPITVQGGHWGQLNSHSEVLHHLEQETRVLWEIVCRINIPDWVTWRKIANSVDEAGRPVALRREVRGIWYLRGKRHLGKN